MHKVLLITLLIARIFSFETYVPVDILKLIMDEVGRQDIPEKKFDNFKSLLRCRAVNKTWKIISDNTYQKLLAIEHEVVRKHHSGDFSKWFNEKRIILPAVIKSTFPEREMACAIERKLFIWLHAACKSLPTIDEPMYMWGTTIIFPLTWAIFLDVPEVKKILLSQPCYKKNEITANIVCMNANDQRQSFHAYIPSARVRPHAGWAGWE